MSTARTAAELRKASEHVLYEYEMLHDAPGALEALHRRKANNEAFSMALNNAHHQPGA
jgi:hypothetical protein